MKKLALVGAGGHGRVIADCASLMNQWEEVVFFDDSFGPDKSFGALLEQPTSVFDAFISIGNNKVREQLQTRLHDGGFTVPVIRHSGAIVAQNVNIGGGSVLMAGAIVNPGVKIGQGCIINTAASVDHDCIIQDFAHIAPGARLAGTVNIGARTWVGIGASICENRTVGADVMVAAGAVVVKDISDNKTVMGVPAT